MIIGAGDTCWLHSIAFCHADEYSPAMVLGEAGEKLEVLDRDGEFLHVNGQRRRDWYCHVDSVMTVEPYSNEIEWSRELHRSLYSDYFRYCF